MSDSDPEIQAKHGDSESRVSHVEHDEKVSGLKLDKHGLALRPQPTGK